ncbi:hypothetical protein C7M84_025081 [Penaeus vannamei]|uniref:Uncharacterized protein n=1 Tax=Penaeus vannamei TaxID=6689 RepID=A0A3R7SYL8_PENVA|nr:hypothetical protein C7M84_025081 [Penaeus vannamei]
MRLLVSARALSRLSSSLLSIRAGPSLHVRVSNSTNGSPVAWLGFLPPVIRPPGGCSWTRAALCVPVRSPISLSGVSRVSSSPLHPLSVSRLLVCLSGSSGRSSWVGGPCGRASLSRQLGVVCCGSCLLSLSLSSGLSCLSLWGPFIFFSLRSLSVRSSLHLLVSHLSLRVRRLSRRLLRTLEISYAQKARATRMSKGQTYHQESPTQHSMVAHFHSQYLQDISYSHLQNKSSFLRSVSSRPISGASPSASLIPHSLSPPRLLHLSSSLIPPPLFSFLLSLPHLLVPYPSIRVSGFGSVLLLSGRPPRQAFTRDALLLDHQFLTLIALSFHPCPHVTRDLKIPSRASIFSPSHLWGGSSTLLVRSCSLPAGNLSSFPLPCLGTKGLSQLGRQGDAPLSARPSLAPAPGS